MTGYTVHTGSSLKFSSGWDRVFEGVKPAGQTTASPAKKSALPARTSKKAAVKKTAKKANAKRPAKSAKKKSATKAVKRGK